MSRRDPAVPLRHMLDYAQKAITISHGRGRKVLDEDLTFNLALTHLVEVIGEAATVFQKNSKRNIPKFRGHKSLV